MFTSAPHPRSTRRPLAALAAIALTGALAAPVAAAPKTAPVVPSTIAVEAGHKVSLVGHAVGVQKYTCNTVAGGGHVWGPGSTPQADLFDDHGKLIMTHFGGPSWQTKDGSTVVAARVDGVPVAGTIPWLLLKVTSATDGPDGGDRLSGTKFIQRVNTTGGVAPAASTCDATTVGQVQEIPYTADYFFWKKQG